MTGCAWAALCDDTVRSGVIRVYWIVDCCRSSPHPSLPAWGRTAAASPTDGHLSLNLSHAIWRDIRRCYVNNWAKTLHYTKVSRPCIWNSTRSILFELTSPPPPPKSNNLGPQNFSEHRVSPLLDSSMKSCFATIWPPKKKTWKINYYQLTIPPLHYF